MTFVKLSTSAAMPALALAMLMPSHALAQIAPPVDSDPTAVATDPTPADTVAEDGVDIVIFGRGETRQVQTVTAADISAAVPGTSAIKVLEKLPGVSVQSANALGTNEWSTRISIRGFNQNQLGFTLDGVPLGDMSYGNFNGLHISRAISSENIGRTTVAQGSGSLNTASSSNLGGTLQFYSMAPANDFGITAEGSYGSEDAYRLFGRLESGEILNGIKGYVSGAYIDAPKWKGQGKQEAYQVNSKIVVPLGGESTLTAFANWSNFKDDDYMDLSLSLIDQRGYDWDYLRYDFVTAQAIATNLQAGTYCASYAGYTGTICGDDTYYDGYGLRKDFLTGATLDVKPVDWFELKLSPYHHNNHGLGTWWTPYNPTPGGAPISIRTTAYDIDRSGFTGSVAFKTGVNTLELGGWYEANDYVNRRVFYPLAAGTTSSVGPRQDPGTPYRTQYKYNYDIDTIMYFVQDTLRISDAFKITGGWKGLSVRVVNKFDPISDTPSRDTSGTLKSEDMFLPQIGANFMLNPQFELFASYTENMRAFDTGPFSTTRDGFQAIVGNIKPETSKTVEGGVRLHLDMLEGSIAGYHVRFNDRLLAVAPCAIVVGCASVLSNVGSVTSNGVEAAATLRFTRAFSLYGSYAYQDAQYDDDTLNNGTQPTAGKQVVDVPKHLASAELAYDDSMLFGRVGVNYQSKRYYTFTNDQSVDGRVLVNLTAGFRWNGLEVQGNVTNLFDKRYVATIGQNGYAFTDPTRSLQSLLAGAPRQAFVSVRAHF